MRRAQLGPDEITQSAILMTRIFHAILTQRHPVVSMNKPFCLAAEGLSGSIAIISMGQKFYTLTKLVMTLNTGTYVPTHNIYLYIVESG